MKKVILILLLIFIINKAVAGHVGFSNDENLLIYIPLSILLIWWVVQVLHKAYKKYREEVKKYQDQTSKTDNLLKLDKEIPEFFREKDVFGLDKPTLTSHTPES
jgi:hypothetical protein